MLKRITSAILPITTQIGATACGHGRRSAVASNYPMWAPRPGEWKPGMKWAAMDPDGAVFQYKYKPSPRYKRWSVAVGAYAPYAMRVPVQTWTEAVVQRPEMW